MSLIIGFSYFQIMYVILFILLLVTIFLVWDSVRPRKFPPGPRFFPLIGNYIYFNKRLSILKFHHLVWHELSEIYGPVVGLRLGRTLMVNVSGPEAIREVLFRDEFDGRPDGFFFRMRTFGKRLGVAFCDGPLWQNQRKFSLQHLRYFGLGRKEMELSIVEETKDLVESIKKSQNNPLNVHQLFDVGVLNVLWSMTAGNRFALDDARLLQLISIIHDAFQIMDMSGGLLNQMPFLRYVAPELCNYTRITGLLHMIWEFLEETVAEHKNTVCKLHTRDLIDAFLHKMHVDNVEKDTFTDEQLLSLLLDLLMAGTETTSNTLVISLQYMIKYPEVQRTVQDELDRVVGRNRWPSLEDKTRLPYTEAVLMEIQRLANVPPLGVAHRTTASTDLFGHHIPEGTMVFTNLYGLHMDPYYWKDPKNFRPERFLDENDQIIQHEMYYLPYGNGKRRCLGESLARANYFLFFTAIFHNFHVQTIPGTMLTMELSDGVTLSPKPFKAIFKLREE